MRDSHLFGGSKGDSGLTEDIPYGSNHLGQ